MYGRLALTSLLVILLTGCANRQVVSDNSNLSFAGNTLAEAAVSASSSMRTLAQVEEAAHPHAKVVPPPDPSCYGMGMHTSIDWSGPVEPLVRNIAKLTNYKVQVLGNAPAIPIIIELNEDNQAIGTILRDAGYQAGKRASIVVFPGDKTIEIRYATVTA